MNMFEVKTDYIDVSVPLEEKYVIVSGDSDRGKSFFVAEVGRIKDSDLEGIECPYRVEVVRTKGELDNLKSMMFEDTIVVVVDEFYVNAVLLFSQNKNMYVVGMSRKNFRNINMSYKSLYKAYREDGVTKFKQDYNLSISKNSTTEFDEILVEDEKAGYEFFKKLYGEKGVRSCKGKTGVCGALSECKPNSVILLIVDGGGIASEIENIYNKIVELKQFNIEVVVCLPVCFEFLFLCSGYMGWGNDVYNTFELKYNNTEHFSEYILGEKTKGTRLEYLHKNQELSLCWTSNCCECELYKDCSLKADQNKFLYILKEGPNPELLKCTIKRGE